MMCSDPAYHHAARIIARLETLLDEEQIARHIDKPIDKAAAEFNGVHDSEYSWDRFQSVTAEFVRHLYEKALPSMRELPLAQARDEAIALLEPAYPGTYADGYYGALLDAADPCQSGLDLVLVRMAELAKTRQREMYVRYVAVRHIGGEDWGTKCAMAAVLIERCREYLPPELQNGPPDQWADHVGELLAIDMATSSQLHPFPAHPTNSR